MKILATTLLIIIAVCVCFGQKTEKAGPKFDIVDFNKKAETAEWLVRYDIVAWKTTDVLVAQNKAEMPKLGPEWFCIEDKAKDRWHAIYGKLANGEYNVAVHYLMDTAGKITKTSEKLDQKMLDGYANALATARVRLETKVPKGSVKFNQYIRRNSDDTFDVWMLPAFQPNGVAVFGGEGIYHLDSGGDTILSDSSYFQPNLRGFQTGSPREIWLNYSELEKPTLGSVFFVLYYKEYFTRIMIDNSTSTSTLLKDPKNSSYMWVNIEKDPAEHPKSSKPDKP